MGKKRPVRLRKQEKAPLTLNEIIRGFRTYLPHLLGAVVAVLILFLAVTWFKQASARREAAAWSEVFAMTPEDLARVAEGYPTSSAAPWALSRQVQLLYEQGRYQDLVAAVQKLETEYPSHAALPAAYLFLAKAYWDTGDLEEAVRTFESPHLTNSQYAQEARWYAAVCSEILEDLDRAKTLYQQVSAGGSGSYWGELASQRLARLGSDLRPLRPLTGSSEPPESAPETQ